MYAALMTHAALIAPAYAALITHAALIAYIVEIRMLCCAQRSVFYFEDVRFCSLGSVLSTRNLFPAPGVCPRVIYSGLRHHTSPNNADPTDTVSGVRFGSPGICFYYTRVFCSWLQGPIATRLSQSSVYGAFIRAKQPAQLGCFSALPSNAHRSLSSNG